MTTTESTTRDLVALAIELRCKGRRMREVASILTDLGHTTETGRKITHDTIHRWTKGRVRLVPR